MFHCSKAHLNMKDLQFLSHFKKRGVLEPSNLSSDKFVGFNVVISFCRVSQKNADFGVRIQVAGKQQDAPSAYQFFSWHWT